jgi:hypothetical protein
VLTLLIMASGIPVSLSFGPWSDYTLFGKTMFDLLDYLTSNLMMPLFGLVLTLLLGWKLGDSIVPADLSPLMRGALLWCWRLVAPADRRDPGAGLVVTHLPAACTCTALGGGMADGGPDGDRGAAV